MFSARGSNWLENTQAVSVIMVTSIIVITWGIVSCPYTSDINGFAMGTCSEIRV
jgi:hypothetical protein